MITGVNLGNWLVLEKWMSPALFDGTDAEDETQLCADLDEDAKQERLTRHRDTWITERDFVLLAARGVDTVRIPVPYFVFGGHPPYVGCIEHLDRAFSWAQATGIRVLIDLHTVPDSQNGFDNGGMSGVCKWHTDPDHVELALTVLERLAQRYRDHPALWGIEVLNEPISEEVWQATKDSFPARDPEYARGSASVPTEFLKGFYLAAYRRIRAKAPEATVVFHDGFRITEWDGFFEQPEFERIVLDTHQYLFAHTMQGGEETLDAYLRLVREQFAPLVREFAARVPLIIGEWSLDPMSARIDALPPEQRHEMIRILAEAQLEAWRPAAGWFFWSYKIQVADRARDGWDFTASLEGGSLPDGLAPAR